MKRLLSQTQIYSFRFAPSVVLAIGLLTTVTISVFLFYNMRAETQARFDRYVERVSRTIEDRLDHYVSLLEAGASVFAIAGVVSEEQFRTFIGGYYRPEDHPGIQGIGFALRVDPGEKEEVMAAIRRESPGYELHPSGDRSVYFPIVYLEPQDWRNRAAIGYDMFSEPVRREAMSRARDAGRTVASAKTSLVQEIDDFKQSGFLIYAPAYRSGTIPGSVEERQRELIGFVYSPFRADDLILGIFGNAPQLRIHFEVYEGKVGPENLLHRSPNDPAVHPRFTTNRQITVAGRSWHIEFSSTPALEASSQEDWLPAIAGGGLLLSLILFHVVAALSKAEKELKKHSANLEATVAERTAELHEMIGELEAFSYSVSHDMRGPLRAIQGMAYLLQENSGAKINSEDRVHLDRIQGAALRLDHLIQDVLSYSRVIRAEIKLVPVELEPLISEIIANYPELQPPGSDVIIKRPLARVMAHEASLTQCISNLLGNAVKFVAPGTKSRVEIWTEEGNKKVNLFIRDNGIGIEPQHREHIFRIFERIHPDSEYPGTGIGLAIVKKGVERMGGDIELESEVGKGTTFCVRLPKVKEAAVES